MEYKAYKIGVICLIVLILGFNICGSFNEKTYTITITDKDRIITHNTSKYLVFGDDEQGTPLVFENTDNIIRLKFRSSNVQGGLKVGKTYDITVVGFRIPVFSIYENIVDYYEITD